MANPGVKAIVGSARASLPRTALAVGRGHRILVGPRFRVRGIQRVSVPNGWLRLGSGQSFGFADSRTPGLLRVEGNGRVTCGGSFAIGIGGRWDIRGQVDLGHGSYFGPDSLVVVSTGLTIGAGCAISWRVQVLDDDFHEVASSPNAAPTTARITIGDRVWIGTGATILKGARIADGSVVAAGSTVTGRFEEPNCLLAGTPAKIMKRDLLWR